IDTMHAILHDPVPPLPALGANVTRDATGDLQRVLDKALAKDPNDRYQGMRDIVVDLRAARRRLESTTTSGATAISTLGTPAGFMRAKERATAAVVAVVVLLIGIGYMRSRFAPSATPVSSSAGDKPSVAVMYFENNTGNPQLDWLRTGLTDMLVN